jgi:hypothetical protein
MKTLSSVFLFLAALAFDAEASAGFATSFEPAPGAAEQAPLSGWFTSGAVQIISEQASDGTHSALIAAGDDGLLARDIPVGRAANPLYIDLYLRPAAGLAPADGSFVELGVSAVGFIRTPAGVKVLAFDGDGKGAGRWVPLDVASTDGRWVRITFRHDYGTARWDLLLDGRLARAGLGFFSVDRDARLSLGIFGGTAGATGVDQIRVGTEPPADIAWASVTGARVDGSDSKSAAASADGPRRTSPAPSPPIQVPRAGVTDPAASVLPQRREQRLKVKLEVYSILE